MDGTKCKIWCANHRFNFQKKWGNFFRKVDLDLRTLSFFAFKLHIACSCMVHSVKLPMKWCIGEKILEYFFANLKVEELWSFSTTSTAGKEGEAGISMIQFALFDGQKPKKGSTKVWMWIIWDVFASLCWWKRWCQVSRETFREWYFNENIWLIINGLAWLEVWNY